MSHRTQITLTDEQYARLRAESAHSGMGLAELVRRALDRSYGASTHNEVEDALERAFGSWDHGADDGAAYVEGLRPGMAARLGRA